MNRLALGICCFLLSRAAFAGDNDSCSVNPKMVMPGSTATVFCDCDEVTAWSTSGGLITSSGARATVNTNGVQPGSLSISGNCRKAGVVSAFTAVLVIEAPPPPPPPQAAKLATCELPNRKKPWRVDNSCKAELDDVAIRMGQDPNMNLVIVGTGGPTDKEGRLAAQRAVNAKAYLTIGEAKQRIAPGRIEVRAGKSGEALQFWLVPAGATFPVQDTERVNEQKVRPIPQQRLKH